METFEEKVFDDAQEFLSSIREYAKSNLDAKFEVHDQPKKMLFGFKSSKRSDKKIITQTIFWFLNVGKLKDLKGFMQEEEFEKVLEFMELSEKLQTARRAYIETVVGQIVNSKVPSK